MPIKALGASRRRSGGSTNGSISGRWFRSDSWINRGVPTTPAIDPNSATWVSTMLATVTAGFWTNGLSGVSGNGSTPVWLSTGSEATRTITLDIPYAGSTNFTFPHFNPAWVTTTDGDAHLVIIHPDGSLIEAQALNLSTNHAHSIGQQSSYNVITGTGAVTTNDHVAPLCLLAGLIRPSEVAAGVIQHGLRGVLPTAAWSNVGRYPGGSSGDGNNASGAPSGACFWLPRSANLSSISGNTYQNMIATAMQNYGLWLGDAGGSNLFTLQVESTIDGSSYPFTSLQLPQAIVSQLQVLATSNFPTSG